LGVSYVPIEFGINGKRRSIRIQDALVSDVDGIEGADPNRETLVTDPKFTVASPYDPVVARSNKNSYHDHGVEWNSTDKNGYYSRFTYGS